MPRTLTARSNSDLIRALPFIMHEMGRVPVAKNWGDAQRKGLILLQEPHKTLAADACMDSSSLAIRALDEFFRTRINAPKGTHLRDARPGDIFAEEFGYIENEPLLSECRRRDINQLMGHFTWRRIDENLKIKPDDLVCVIPHCIRFLTWLTETGFLDGEHELTAEAISLRANMQRVLDDPNWGRQLNLEIPEGIVKATACAVSGSTFAATSTRWSASASRTPFATDGGGSSAAIMRFQSDPSELTSLLKILDTCCANEGLDTSFEGYPLGQIRDWWKELSRQIMNEKG